MDIRLAVPDELDDADRKAALDAALESVTRTAASQVRNGKVPPAAGEIKSGRVRWEPEPPGAEHFDLPGTVIGRGWGDCDDLAPWHAGSLRASGRDPGARAIVRKSGPKRWHAIVQRSDGSIEDPSAHAGMHSVSGLDPAVVGAAAPIHKAMSADGRMCLALCPTRDPRHPLVFFTRCDVPDKLETWDWSSMAADLNPAHSIAKAIRTVRAVAGDDMEAEDDARLAAVHGLVLGHSADEVADALYDSMGEEVDIDGCMADAEHTVGWFGSDLFKAVTAPVSSAINFVKHPSLTNLTRMGTDPFNAALHAVPGHQLLQPLARMAQPFAGMIPGLGPFASAGLDALSHGGLPSDPGQLAAFAARNAANFIPGGGMLANVLRAGGGGGFNPMSLFGGDLGQVLRPWGAGAPAVMKF